MEYIDEEHDLKNKDRFWTLTPPLTSCVTSGNLYILSQFPG